ncbi:MAG: TonB-dependent receptor, partial [Methylococcales bacterium]|nr:TonB-dependent receptor [Methylococcales bacterium]
ALWFLEVNSELVWVGDEGVTETQGASERYGIEWTNYYQVTDWLTLDADFAFTHSEFKNAPEGAEKVPLSLGTVITTGATIDLPNGIFTSVRMRHFDDVPLNESGSIEAGATTLVNLGLGYRYKGFRIEGNIFNLFDRRDNDVAYLYQNRLQGEVAGSGDQGGHEDIHFHPVESRTFRIQFTYSF